MELWNKIKDFFIINGWKILIALAFIILAIIIIKVLSSILKKVLKKRQVDDIVSYFITTAVNIALIVILIVAVFDMLGVSVAPFVAVLGTLGLALALSMQDSISNIASGLLLIIEKPFKKGDYVEIGSTGGTIQKINLLTTELTSPDNKKIVLPNNIVAKTQITNYSCQDIRRVDFKFGVAYGSSIEKVKQVIGDTIKKHENILKDPAPQIRLFEHGDSAITFITRVWVKTPEYWAIYFDLQEEVYDALNVNEIEIPYNKLDVTLLNNKIEKK